MHACARAPAFVYVLALSESLRLGIPAPCLSGFGERQPHDRLASVGRAACTFACESIGQARLCSIGNQTLDCELW